jgi:hypothetical protein
VCSSDLYAFYVPLIIPFISLPIFKFLNFNKDNHHLTEVLFGPAAIFSTFFTYQDNANIRDFHFLFKNELLEVSELKNTSKFYMELSKKSTYIAENLSQKEKLPDIPNKWNLDKSMKLYKEYISLNIPPSEIYLEGKNEPAKMSDIINASWFYFFEKIFPNMLENSRKQDNSTPIIQSDYATSFTNESIEEQEKMGSFVAKKNVPQDDVGGNNSRSNVENDMLPKGDTHSHSKSAHCCSYNEESSYLSFPKSFIGNPPFSEQLFNLCALILRGIETSNIFRKLKKRGHNDQNM